MSHKRDLTGKKFGSLTVIEETGRDKNKHVLWYCKCDCGGERITTGYALISGRTKKCQHCNFNSYSLSDDGSYMIGTFPNGAEFLFDIDDYEKVKAYTWYQTGTGSASAYVDGIYILQHRLIMTAPKDVQIDHKNMVRSDNRKLNLRFATDTENKRNKGLQKNNRSGAKGVWYSSKHNKYEAYIGVDGRKIHLGYHPTVIKASQAYDQAALRYFGEFARLNSLGEKTPERVSFLLRGGETVAHQDVTK